MTSPGHPPTSTDPPGPSIALVHDYLTQRGGAEQVVLAMARAFPGAPLHTSLYWPDGTYPAFSSIEIRTSALDRVKALRANHRLALPVLAPAFSSMRVEADVVLCSSSGWAHGVRATGRKVVYCHAPARWLHQPAAYLANAGRATTTALRVLRPALMAWDRRAATSADRYLVNSSATQAMVRRAYGLDAEVLHPPHAMDPAAPRVAPDGLEPGSFYLCVSRLLAYKHVDVVVEAFRERRLPLVVVGSGPEEAALRALAPPNVTFLNMATDAELRWLYAEAVALVGASYEDFGLTPVEAAAFGTPSVVLRFGGYLETVVEGETGTFFDEPTPASVNKGLDALDRARIDPEAVRRQAERFSLERFTSRVRDVVSTSSR